MGYGFLADLLVAVHVAYVAYIVVGQVAVLAGAALHWKWIRNPWFRFTHLLAIGVVAVEAACGIDCPLTVWEARLREASGQEFSGESFVARLLHSILFYDVAPWALNVCHIGFALLVAVTLWRVPPRGLSHSTLDQ